MSYVYSFGLYKFITIQAANNKGADQIEWMRRLICAFVVHIWQKQVSHDVAHFQWIGRTSVVLEGK